MKNRAQLFTLAALTFCTCLGASDSYAQTCPSTIATTITTCTLSSNSTVSVTGNVTGTLNLSNNITSSANAIVQNQGTINTVSVNSGVTVKGANWGINNTNQIKNINISSTASLSGVAYGIYNINGGASIETINNQGTVTNTSTLNGGAIFVGQGDTITTISNSGTLNGLNGITLNFGTTGTISNSGLISAKSPGNAGIYIPGGGSITTISNGNPTNSSATISGPNAFLVDGGTISSVNNYGTITSTTAGTSLQMGGSGKITTLNNYASGQISGGTNGIWVAGGTIGSINNYGNISGTTGAGITTSGGQITTITNFSTGKISGAYGLTYFGGSMSTVNNYGTIQGTSQFGLAVTASLGSLKNTGAIITTSAAVSDGVVVGSSPGAVTSFVNSGVIAASSGGGLLTQGSITTLTNTGLMYGGGTGTIFSIGSTSAGLINTLNNLQGPGTAIPSGLTISFPSSTYTNNAIVYRGGLPTNYNIIINSPAQYGSLIYQYRANTAPGTMNFNIYGNTGTTPTAGVPASKLTAGTYSAVFRNIFTTQTAATSNYGSGTSPVALLNTTGTYPSSTGAYTWKLVQEGSTPGVWDLVVTGSSSDGPGPINGFDSDSGSGSGSDAGDGTTTGSNDITTIVAPAAPSCDRYVAQGTSYSGTGVMPCNVVVAGTLSPGNSPGYYSVLKNVKFVSGSTFEESIAGVTQSNSQVPFGSAGHYSFMNIAGQLIIEDGATLAPKLQGVFLATEPGYGSAPYVPSLGDTFRIVTAAEGITGTFTKLIQPAGLASGTKFIVFYNYGGSNSLDLAVIPSSYANTLASSSTNGQAIASVLDKLSNVQMTGNATTAQSNLMYPAATQTSSRLADFAQALSGEIYASTIATLPQATSRTQQAVMARLSDTFASVPANHQAAMSSSGITVQNPSGEPSASWSTNPEVNPVKDMSIPYRPNVWGEVALQHTRRLSDSNASGLNSNLYQAVFGADFYKENLIKAGAGFSLSSSNVSMNSGTAAIAQGSLFVYGSMPVLQNYVLDAMASFGLNSTNVTRNDPISSNSLKASNVLGDDLLLSAGISRPVELKSYGLTLTPYARATWQRLNQSTFDEGTSSAAALVVSSYSGSAMRGVMGLAVGSLNKDPLKDAYTYRANIAVGADTAGLLNPTLNTTLGGFSSRVTTAKAGSAFVQMALYGTAKIADNAYVYAGVSGEARTGQTLYGGSVGLRMAF